MVSFQQRDFVNLTRTEYSLPRTAWVMQIKMEKVNINLIKW